MENYDYLNDIIDSVIDEHIIYRDIDDLENKEQIINLYYFECLNLSDEELSYVMGYLNKQNIIVEGNYSAVFSDFENYRCAEKRNKTKYFTMKEEEQNKLLKQYKINNDIDAKKKLVESYCRLVNSIANKYSYYSKDDLNDLINSGYEGLLVAIDKFEFKDNKFITFASTYIRGYILKEVNRLNNVHQICFNYPEFNSVRKNIRNNYQYDLDYSEVDHLDEIIDGFLSVEGDWKQSQKTSYIRAINAIYAAPLDDFEDDIIASDNISLYKETIEPSFQQHLNIRLYEELSMLPTKERRIIELYYGLGDKNPSIEAEIAKKYGMCCTSVYNYIHRGFKSLRNNLESLYLEDLREYDEDSHTIINKKSSVKKKV